MRIKESDSDVLAIRGVAPIAIGSTRLVYQHPNNRDHLIKVLKRDRADARWTRKFGWLPVTRRYGVYTESMREIREYIAVRSRIGVHPPPLERVVGLAETDLGLGLVVAKVRGRDGRLAPTLESVVLADGLTKDILDGLDALAEEVLRLDIITGDLSARNVLHGHEPSRGDHLVIVDGIGDKGAVPFSTLSRTINRRANLRHFRRLRNALVSIDRQRVSGVMPDTEFELSDPAHDAASAEAA